MVTSEEPQVWELYVRISFCELLAWQQCSEHAEVWIQLRRSHHTLMNCKKISWPNESKFGRKHPWKVFYKDWSFSSKLLTNMAATGNSCFWLVDF
jgi:hypothetical protein